jgi:seryl-tRNA synthetase
VNLHTEGTTDDPCLSAPDGGEAAPSVLLSREGDERLFTGLRSGLTRLAAAYGPMRLFAPPVISEDIVSRAGYTESFPHLLGKVYAQSDAAVGPDGRGERPTGLMLTPAVCHHVYPLLSGHRIDEPRFFMIEGDCYRHEATAEPGRLRSFRMLEVVMVGPPEQCRSWRDAMLECAREWLTALGLGHTAEVANDPFFGRAGILLGRAQLEEQLKWELRAEVDRDVRQAVASFNYHKDHFGEAFSLVGPTDDRAHSSCAAFGLNRLALALTLRHGRDMDSWPTDVQRLLNPS